MIVEIRDTWTCEPFRRGLKHVIATVKAAREFNKAVDKVIGMMKITEISLNDLSNSSKVRIKGYIGETPKRFKKRTFSGKKGTFGRK